MSLIVWLKYPEEQYVTRPWKKYLISILTSLAIFASGFTFRVPEFHGASGMVNQYQNQRVADTRLASLVQTEPGKRYLIFFFSYTCPHCWNSIENLRKFRETNTVDSITIPCHI